MTSGASAEVRAALMAYGEKLGLAFQVVDDVLDLIAGPNDTGKGRGTDLQEGVFTLPVLLACARDPELGTRLVAGDRTLDSILPTVKATGGLEDAISMARDLGAGALEEITGVGSAAWREGMETIVEGVLGQLR